MLTLDFLPNTCLLSSLRTELSSGDWIFLKNKVCKGDDVNCAACNCISQKNSLKLYVEWVYDDENKIQLLANIVGLCPDCYQVKCIDSLSEDKRIESVKHLAKINNWNIQEAELYLKKSFSIKDKRSKYNWQTDVSYLTRFNIKLCDKTIKNFQGDLKEKATSNKLQDFKKYKWLVRKIYKIVVSRWSIIAVICIVVVISLKHIFPFRWQKVLSYNTHPAHSCQPYSKVVFIDGKEEKITGMACLAPDGTWHMWS